MVPAKGDSPQPELLNLGLRIRDERERRGMSAEALAEASGLSVRGLLYIEHGRRNPSYLTLLALVDALGISFGELAPKAVRKVAAKRPNSTVKRRRSE
jgi:transcriptional regulator with XRE-family HTH domain